MSAFMLLVWTPVALIDFWIPGLAVEEYFSIF